MILYDYSQIGVKLLTSVFTGAWKSCHLRWEKRRETIFSFPQGEKMLPLEFTIMCCRK